MIDWENSKPSDFKFRMKPETHETGDHVTYMVVVVHKATDKTAMELPIMVPEAIDADLKTLGQQGRLDGLNKIIATQVKEQLKTRCGQVRLDIDTRLKMIEQPDVEIED